MGTLVCKIKQSIGTAASKIKKIQIDCGVLYSGIENFKVVEFNPTYKIEKDEIFVIDKFSEKISKNDKELLKNFNLIAINYDQLDFSQWGTLDFLVHSKDGWNFYQRIIGKKYLSEKKVLKCVPRGISQISNEPEGVEINSNSYLMYHIEKDKFYFKKLEDAIKIFKEVENLSREATTLEVEEFFNIPLINNNSSLDKSKISSYKRKKILLALNEFKDKGKKIEELVEYGNIYYKECFVDNQISIDDNDKLDIVLDIIHENYYTTEISGERRKSNSNKKLD
ncbi:MAG: hypothetical protein ACRC18_00190 [Cetobacterium sp.]